MSGRIAPPLNTGGCSSTLESMGSALDTAAPALHRSAVPPRRVLALALALGAAPFAARAQCPDGTPPPCAGARRVIARTIPSPSERARRFLVLPFRNVTRGAEQEWLVEGSPILLADAIGRWQDLSVVSDERLYPAMRRHGLQPGAVMDLARVRQVAEETNGWTAVTGEVLAMGGRVRVSARAWDVVTNRELMRVTEETQPGEDVRRAYGRIGSRLLGAAGLDSSALDLEAATTRSLDAYRAYLRGVAHLRRSEARRAREALLEAVRLDTAFAQAYLRLAEASFAISPTDVLSLTSPAIRYTERAAALADRLPQRQRDLVRGISDLVHGRFTASRATLGRLVASDSSDIDALEWMAGVEIADPILVPAPGGGERPRGSLNTGLRLEKRALELDPTRHHLYADLVLRYANVAGLGAARALGLRHEPPSLGAMVMSLPDRSFGYILRDTFELVPQESLSTVSADTLRASRRRALAAAGAWARRWRQEAPGEADASLWLSRIYDMEGSLDSALGALARAESLGVETGIDVPAIRRLSLLNRLGRMSAARAIADSIWAAGTFRSIGLTTRADAAAEVLRVFLMTGDYARCDSILAGFADMIARMYPRDLAEMAALGNMTGGIEGTVVSSLATPGIVDSMLTAVGRRPPEGRPARWVPALIVGSTAGLPADSMPRMRSRILEVSRDLATRGQGPLAWRLASHMDSTGRAAAEREPWYAERRTAMHGVHRAVAQRFRPGSATVSGDSVVFEWTVSGGDTVTWNRALTPFSQSEYTWSMTAGTWRVVVDVSALMDDHEQHGSLSRLLQQGLRGVVDTAATRGPSARLMALIATASAVRAEALPGTIRIVVRRPAFLEALRRQHPESVSFRFEPCPKEDQTAGCGDRAVTVTWQ